MAEAGRAMARRVGVGYQESLLVPAGSSRLVKQVAFRTRFVRNHPSWGSPGDPCKSMARSNLYPSNASLRPKRPSGSRENQLVWDNRPVALCNGLRQSAMGLPRTILVLGLLARRSASPCCAHRPGCPPGAATRGWSDGVGALPRARGCGGKEGQRDGVWTVTLASRLGGRDCLLQAYCYDTLMY